MRTIALTVILALVTVETVAVADEPASKEEARVLVQEGVGLLNGKDYRGALARFNAAYAKFPSPKILLNIGTTLKALGRDSEAANTYQRYLDDRDTDPARKDEIDAILADYDRKLARIALAVNPEDAEVQINLGEWMPAYRATLWRLAPGSFSIKARRTGYAPAERRGDAAIGTHTEVSINLIEEPPEEELEVVNLSMTTTDTTPGDTGERSRFGAAVGAHIDPVNKGAAAKVGVVFSVIERLEVAAAVLLGPTQGAYLGATALFLTGRYRPTVAAGLPMFFSDGTRVSARGAGGVEVIMNRHLSVVAELGVEYAINPEPDIDAWSFIPSVAVHGRL
jgi:tetratricopeptide (TPR) repeat protein